ncbi:MAG: hypothetical protein ACREOK_05545, partial [Gemmatimonadaceae bacterium]
ALLGERRRAQFGARAACRARRNELASRSVAESERHQRSIGQGDPLRQNVAHRASSRFAGAGSVIRDALPAAIA